MLPAASAVLRLSSLLSPRATSPFIAALASKREEDPSNRSPLLRRHIAPLKHGAYGVLFNDFYETAKAVFSFSTFCDIFPFLA
jgi:hypothetical protein